MATFDVIHTASAVSNALHVLAAVAWVGGMCFAYLILRPAVGGIEPAPERLKLWSRVFPRFFAWVWAAVVVLPLTGYWRLFLDFGGFARAGGYVHLMHVLGLVMIGLFVFLYVFPYRRFQVAVAASDFPTAAPQLAVIRRIVGTNLALGLFVAAVAAFGRLWV
ncbi:MAG: CopD family protein [Rhodospirillales bacterium]|nr:CopD family protein [Rhodospirillales bacterium]